VLSLEISGWKPRNGVWRITIHIWLIWTPYGLEIKYGHMGSIWKLSQIDPSMIVCIFGPPMLTACNAHPYFQYTRWHNIICQALTQQYTCRWSMVFWPSFHRCFFVTNQAATNFSVDSVIKHLDRLQSRGCNALGVYWLDPHVIMFTSFCVHICVYLQCSVL